MTLMMSKEEYRSALAQLGLTQGEAGRLLNVADRSSRRYATEEDTIPGPVEVMLRLWLERPELLQVVRRMADERSQSKKTEK